MESATEKRTRSICSSRPECWGFLFQAGKVEGKWSIFKMILCSFLLLLLFLFRKGQKCARREEPLVSVSWTLWKFSLFFPTLTLWVILRIKGNSQSQYLISCTRGMPTFSIYHFFRPGQVSPDILLLSSVSWHILRDPEAFQYHIRYT